MTLVYLILYTMKCVENIIIQTLKRAMAKNIEKNNKYF